ncbi:MAG: integrin alpha, partial [Chloroflexi bacterium]|nr:integrin alpha [Chloroflexota bacterium]
LSAALLAFSLGLPLLRPDPAASRAPQHPPLVVGAHLPQDPAFSPGWVGGGSGTIDLGALGAAGITLYGVDDYDFSGSVSRAGDVNGDGYDDMLIGAVWGQGPANSRLFAGETYLVFGSSSLPATVDLAALGTAGVTIFGADERDYSGYGVSAAGDVNGDGYDDLLIGADRADGPANSRDWAGESYLVFGGSALPATIDLAVFDTPGVILFGAESGDRSAYAVSGVGDANGDGYDDLLIGANGADGPANSRYDAGESYLVFGGSALPATIDLATIGPAGVILYGVDDSDASGISVSGAGDANGDGYDDLLIGARGADGPANTSFSTGESYLVFGRSAWPASVDLAVLDTMGVILYGVDTFDNSGRAVSGAGDVNSDGYDDLLIGALFADGPANSRDAAGEGYLIFGGSAWPATVDLGALGTAGVTLYGVDPGDFAGSSLSRAGDVNGDGYDDLLMGANSADGPANSRYDAGECYLVFGASSWPATIDLATLGTAGVILYGAGSENAAGAALDAAGDVNGDGYNDLLIGAPVSAGPGNSGLFVGESYLIIGAPGIGRSEYPLYLPVVRRP